MLPRPLPFVVKRIAKALHLSNATQTRCPYPPVPGLGDAMKPFGCKRLTAVAALRVEIFYNMFDYTLLNSLF